ncbi:uncharacterized protein LOC119294092 isoform X2 [Triticum dicoccoides]|nr:uncharacterized protein LOC119294092 isoform X2 [Triticum dicoccoides]
MGNQVAKAEIGTGKMEADLIGAGVGTGKMEAAPVGAGVGTDATQISDRGGAAGDHVLPAQGARGGVARPGDHQAARSLGPLHCCGSLCCGAPDLLPAGARAALSQDRRFSHGGNPKAGIEAGYRSQNRSRSLQGYSRSASSSSAGNQAAPAAGYEECGFSGNASLQGAQEDCYPG